MASSAQIRQQLVDSLQLDLIGPSCDDVTRRRESLTQPRSMHIKQELEALMQRPTDLLRMRQRMNPERRAVFLQEGISAL